MRKSSPSTSIMGITIFIIILFMSFSVSATENKAKSKAGEEYSDGYKAYQSTDFQEAIGYFEASYKLMPHTKTAYYLSRSFYGLYRPKKAREYAEHALSDRPILGVRYRKNAREIVLWAQKIKDQSKRSIEFSDKADEAAIPRPELSLDPEIDLNPPSFQEMRHIKCNKKSQMQLKGVYMIQQKSSHRFADAHEGSNDNSMVTRNYQNNNTQRWIFTPLGNNTFTIQQKSSQRYADAHEGMRDNSMVTRNRQNNNTQRWILSSLCNKTYTIQQKSNHRFMDAHEGTNDNSIVTRAYQNNDTQRWIISRP